MRQIVGYILITASVSAGLLFLFVSFMAMDELRAVFGFGSVGLLVAGCALCADELFGIRLPRKRKSRR